MSDAKKKETGATVNLPGQLKLAVDDAVAQGMYSNFQAVGSNETEFVLDFAYVQPQQPRGKVRARVILSPKHAKSLLAVLSERVRDHESRYGTIALPVRKFVTGWSDGGGGLPN